MRFPASRLLLGLLLGGATHPLGGCGGEEFQVVDAPTGQAGAGGAGGSTAGQAGSAGSTAGAGGSASGAAGAGGASGAGVSGSSGQGGGACEGGQTDCNGVCVDTSSDVNNCNGCGQKCAALNGLTPVCVNAKCDQRCPNGNLVCDNACRDYQTDPSHCGECNNPCPAKPGESAACQGGKCVTTCQPSHTKCDNTVCVNTDSDPNNCGSCGNACKKGEFCNGGECGTSCSGGKQTCGMACVDTTTSPEHCGGCDVACANPSGGTATCSDGQCIKECAAPEEKVCDDVCVSLATIANCGACGNACNSGEACVDKVCTLVASTCEPSSCSKAIYPSKSGFSECVNNECTATCNPKRHACPASNPSDALCPLEASPVYCGEGCTLCDPAEQCIEGKCQPAVCPPHQSTCGGGNECFNLLSDKEHCGGCDTGNKCATISDCLGGKCIGACDEGNGKPWKACLDPVGGGLVTCANTLLDPEHCGGCNQPCGNAEVCLGGTCVGYHNAAEPWDCTQLDGDFQCCKHPLSGTLLCVEAPPSEACIPCPDGPM